MQELVDLIKAGGTTAGPLATASWGAYYLPDAVKYPPPFDAYVPWLCFAVMAAGAFSASVIIVRRAFA